MPVIERVLSEVSIPHRQIHIERLEVNLGDMQLSEFENVAADRLYRELKEAVERAISSPLNHGNRPEHLSRLELFEWYLLRGSLPYWAVSAPSFSLGAWFADLSRQDPDALVRLFRKAGTQDQALERIVYQMSNGALRSLVALLEPENAGLIFAYMIDLTEVQREESIAPVDEREFDRLLWLLVLSYLIRDAGSQFNRKVFVESLIRRFGAYQGLEYEATLVMLRKSLERTVARRGLPSSLPAVIAELLQDTGRSDALPPSAAGESETMFDEETLAELVRRHGSDRVWLESMVDSLDEITLVTLIATLAPNDAAVIVDVLFDVREIHHAEPSIAGEPAQFNRLLWVLALSWLVHERGTQFNRKEFLLSLIRGLAQNEGLDFAAVLDTFRLGLAKAALKAPLRSSLPAILAALLDDLSKGSAPGHFPLKPESEAVTPANLTDLALSLIQSAVASQVSPEDLRLVLAAAGQMQASDLRSLISRILPAVEIHGSLMGDAFRAAGRNCGDAGRFYANVIAAVLRGEDLDFERMAADGRDTPAISYVPGKLDSRILQAVIAARLAAGSDSSDDGVPISLLVADLVRRDSSAARTFLVNVTRRAGAGKALEDLLTRTYSPGTFERILDNLAGRNAPAARQLLRGIGELSGSDRPSIERLRSILLTETLRWNPGREFDETFFGRVLVAAFPVPLPARVRASLVASAPEDATAFRAALSAHDVDDRRAIRFTTNPPRSAVELLALIVALPGPDEEGADTLNDELMLELEASLVGRSDAVYQAVVILLQDRDVRIRLALILNASAWTALVRFLDPDNYRQLLEAAELLASAAMPATPGPSATAAQIVRQESLELLMEGSASVEVLSARTSLQLQRAIPKRIAKARKSGGASRKPAAAAAPRKTPKSVAAQPQVASPRIRPKPPARDISTLPETNYPIHLANAGLVLASPFLPHLFSSLGMLEKNEIDRNRWRDRQAASRAVHLLQFLADGRTSAPEPLLMLNKVLCGLPTAEPVVKSIELTEKETEMCDRLVQAMIANWSILSDSSPAVLQETFFQREGILNHDSGKWKLRVQRKTLDVLVDQVTWSFNPILHDWMPEPLHVTW